MADVYRPDGKCTSIGFGPKDQHSQGHVDAAFGQWFDLYDKFTHRVLGYDSPYQTIEQILIPTWIVRVGQFFDK